MDDLVQWLRTQLDDDERTAQAASAGPWGRQVGFISGGPDGRVRVAQQAQAWNANHITRHDPARVLREIDAKLRIVELHGIMHRDISWLAGDGGEEGNEIPVCGRCVPKHSSYPRREDVPEGACTTVRLLALPYADRPGYREEWRP